MQTITKEYKVYTIDELSDDARKKAFDNHRDWLTNSWNVDGWAEYILEERKESLTKLGYKDVKILFSGFSSQGDGACFTARVDISEWIKAHKLANKYRALWLDCGEHFSINICHNSRYCYSTSTEIEEGYWSGASQKAENQMSEFVALIEKEREVIGNEIYKQLQDEYYYLTDDKTLEENFQENGYTFTAEGVMMNS